MQVKLIMSWDIQQGQDSDYFEFIVREFAPGIARLGIQPTEAWYTVYGNKPQIMMGGIADDHDKVREALTTPEWTDLHQRLLKYVSNYHQKVIRATPFFPV